MGRENTAKAMSLHGFKQVQLTNYLCNNLSQFNLKPTTKLVLLYLSSCFNPKHADVFPKQKTIADRMGISERSVISAIQELHKEGLIISERKYQNRYTFTSRILSQASENENISQAEKVADEKCKSFTPQPENSAPVYIEQTIEQEKEQLDKRLGGNVYSMEEFHILRKYAIDHNARTVVGYIAFLHYNNSAKSVLKKHHQQAFINKRAKTNIAETKQLIAEQQKLSKTAVLPCESEAWNNLRAKFSRK